MGWIARLALELDFDPGAATQDPLSVDSYFFSKSTEINFCGRHATTSAPPTSRHLRQFCPTAFLASDPASCTRDYGENCPEGWMDATGRGNCFPPVSYQGPCKTISVGNNADVTTKEMHSHRCRVKWPCVPQKAAKIDAKGQPMVTRPEDFARICPSGWILAKRGAPDRPQYVCKAPENYTGNCYYEQNMEGLTPSERKTWGRLCEARWPEEPPPTICPGGQDWSHPCPRGWDWLQKGDMCVAPPGWRSSVENALLCPGAIPAFKDADTKRKFTEQCRLEGWSCLKPGGCPAASYHWVVPCPRGWLDFNGYCLPPKDVNLLEGVNKECRHPWFKPDIGNLQRTIAAFGKEKVARVKIPDVVTDKAKWVWSQLCGAEWSCNNPEDNELALGSMDNVNLVDL